MEPFDITESDKAYAAGIIDGEGNLIIHKSKDKMRTRGVHYSIKVQVRMTDPFAVTFLENKFGGCLNERNPYKGGQRKVFDWKLSSKKAEGFLRLVLPYLKTKRSQARLCISFMSIEHFNRFTDQHIKDSIISKRESYYSLLKRLNQTIHSFREYSEVDSATVHS